MSGLFSGARIPAPGPVPAPPNLSDAQSAAEATRAGAAASYGRLQTILSGQGVTTTPAQGQTSKKTLLGATS